MSDNLFVKAIRLCKDANYQMTKGNNKIALSKYRDALKIYDQIGKLPEKATCLNNIGLLYESQGILDQALEFYNQALEIDEIQGDLLNKAISLSNIGRIYESQKKFGPALKYFKEALKLFSQIKLEKKLLYLKEEAESHINTLKSSID